MIVQGVSSKYFFAPGNVLKGYMYNVATNTSCHSNMFNVYNLYLFQFMV